MRTISLGVWACALLSLARCIGSVDAPTTPSDGGATGGGNAGVIDAGTGGNTGAGGGAGGGAATGGGASAGGGASTGGGGGATGGAGGQGGGDAGNTVVDAGQPDAGGIDVFLATGYQNRRIRSLDGVNWTDDVNNPANPLDDVGTGVAFGAGRVILSSHSGLLTSPDAKTWTKLGPPLPQAWPGLGGSSAAWSGSQFLVVAGDDTWTSPDGLAFTKHTQVNTGATHWQGIAVGNGHVMVVGDSNSAGGNRKVTDDGITWRGVVTGGPRWSSVAFGAGVFVIVGAGGARAWTADGETLTTTNDASLGDFAGVTFGQGHFLAVAANGTVTSTDGKSWTASNANPPNGALAFGGGRFLDTSWESNLFTSPDGVTWTKVFSGQAGSPAVSHLVWGRVQGP